jgi:hypothetical protein
LLEADPLTDIANTLRVETSENDASGASIPRICTDRHCLEDA